MIALDGNSKLHLERFLAGESEEPHPYDDIARAQGGIWLFMNFNTVWCLKPDGSLWQIDADECDPPELLPKELETLAIVSGARFHHWLKAYVPAKPVTASTCQHCAGVGSYNNAETLCGNCSGLGWLV